MSHLTLEQLSRYSAATETLITVDAPLLGTVMILNGKVLDKGSAVEPEKIGRTTGFPAPERILSEATRFWVQDQVGVRHCHTRPEMEALVQP